MCACGTLGGAGQPLLLLVVLAGLASTGAGFALYALRRR